MLVGYSVKLTMAVVLYIYMFTANKKRDREAAAIGATSDEEERAAIERGMLDTTELENKGTWKSFACLEVFADLTML